MLALRFIALKSLKSLIPSALHAENRFFTLQNISKNSFFEEKWKNGKGSPSPAFLSPADPSIRGLGQDVASQEVQDGISFINSLTFVGWRGGPGLFLPTREDESATGQGVSPFPH